MNIVLIGMPGSGKTTIGNEIARLTGRRFIDVDLEIIQAAGISIPEIFAKHGEKVFRQYEREQTLIVSRNNDCVIATGGGVVKDKNNYFPLHENGYICHIFRELSLLPSDGRPLSQANDIRIMYEQRKPLYKFFRDAFILNDKTPLDAAKNIIEEFNNFRSVQIAI